MVTIRKSATLASRSRMTVARVALDAAFSRLGCSMIGSPATDRDLTVQRAGHASLHPAGVVELADTPALGAGGASRGGSNPSARMTLIQGVSALGSAGGYHARVPNRVFS